MQLKGALGLLEFIKLELKPYCTKIMVLPHYFSYIKTSMVK